MLDLKTLSPALLSAARFVGYSALAAAAAAATTALPGLGLDGTTATLIGFALATVAKYAGAHRRLN